jgi:Lipoprotein LpqB beta-propeller domain/Sporulation and spore germination
MPRTAGRTASRSALAVAAVLAVAGCVSMPGSGPPGSLAASPATSGQNQDYVAPVPAPAGNGYSPEEIVQGFVVASASYSADPAAALSYLTPAEQQEWNPQGAATVFGTVTVEQHQDLPDGPHHTQQVEVTVAGPVQATLNGNGEFFSAAQKGNQAGESCAGSAVAAGDSCERFTLVKQNGQWRIKSPPPHLLFSQPDFARVYQTQDVYFFAPGNTVLVPDTVFVPKGASVTELLSTLVSALIHNPPTWLAGATSPVIPVGTTVKVSVAAGTATVDLGGAIKTASAATLKEILGQLVWTLAGTPAGQSDIIAVGLEVNGNAWPEVGAYAQKSSYQQYNPYPGKTASFTYVDASGTAQSRCGSVQLDAVGPAAAVFSQRAGPQLATCAGSTASPAPTGQPTVPPKTDRAATRNQNALSMVAASPDDQYVAGVSAGDDSVSIWPVGGNSTAPVVKWNGPDITSLSWDTQHDLWITAQGSIWMIPVQGKVEEITNNQFGGDVTALSVAPDGVRVAAIAGGQPGAGGQLELAAIDRAGNPNQQTSVRATQLAPVPTIGQPIPLGPAVTNPIALTWYDADDLAVVAKTGPRSSELEEVPVNGRSASPLQPSLLTQPGVFATSIAANGSANLVVVGLSNGHLAVSAGLYSVWQQYEIIGAQPAY